MAAAPLWILDHVSLAPSRLRDVSLTLHPGVTAVIGWSGAGKTSLLNVLAGFEKAERGSVRGTASVAWVPQDGGLWPHCTAREHLAIARHGGGGLDSRLAAFDLAARAEARPHELSQGEQARLSVARALAAKAEVLVMDEPLAHVDPARAGNYWRVIREHLTATGASLVFSTHLPEIALGEAERVVCLSDGRVVHDGLVRELYDAPPTPELMTFLGPGNWLTPEEAALWLGAEIQHPRCFRPEQLAITRDAAGAITVESSRFRGSVADVDLRHAANGATRSFFHRPGAEILRAGMRVRAALLVLLAALFIVTGCQRAPQATALTAREWRVWNLPPDGATLPTPRSVAVGNDGEIATLDTAGRVLIYDGEGALKRQWQMLDVRVGKPEGIVVLRDGRVVVCDTHYHRVVWFDANGQWLKNIGAHGTKDGEFISRWASARTRRRISTSASTAGTTGCRSFPARENGSRALALSARGRGSFSGPRGSRGKTDGSTWRMRSTTACSFSPTTESSSACWAKRAGRSLSTCRTTSRLVATARSTSWSTARAGSRV